MHSQPEKPVKQILKERLKMLRRQCVRRCYRFTAGDLQTALQKVGIRSGDVIFVHSSFERFEAFEGTAAKIIQVLQASVGPSGTILMPTIPFTGTSVEYAARNPVFDVQRTPSQMGIISELFRRMPGVRRSVHPTHSVAAWGAKAEQLISDHFMAETPCGRYTPYGRLLAVAGKLLFLGTSVEAMTFFHTVEEELEEAMPFSPFTRDTFVLASKDANGILRTTTTRLFDPAYSHRRRISKLVPALATSGHWKHTRVGNLEITLLNAVDVLQVTKMLCEQGIYCYETEV
jgi:aminoglycoside 3-N-acetyltransferase